MMKREHWLGAGLLLAACGCAGNVQVVKPDDMSAADHRREAKREQAAARQLDTNIVPPDPLAWQQPTEAPSGFVFPVSPLNPEVSGNAQASAQKLRQADGLREEAHQHRRAARTLEHAERTACGDTPASARAACPVLGPLTTLHDIPGGVRATFADPTQVDAVVERMRCHFAYEQTRGFDPATSCEIYMRGVNIKRAPQDPASVDITSPDPGDADELRALSREQAVFAADAAPPQAAR
jgi:hypothetical protein